MKRYETWNYNLVYIVVLLIYFFKIQDPKWIPAENLEDLQTLDSKLKDEDFFKEALLYAKVSEYCIIFIRGGQDEEIFEIEVGNTTSQAEIHRKRDSQIFRSKK